MHDVRFNSYQIHDSHQNLVNLLFSSMFAPNYLFKVDIMRYKSFVVITRYFIDWDMKVLRKLLGILCFPISCPNDGSFLCGEIHMVWGGH